MPNSFSMTLRSSRLLNACVRIIKTTWMVGVLSAAFIVNAEDSQALMSDSNVDDALALIVLKTPTCGCCKKWIDHLETEGVAAQSKDYERLDGIKTQLGIAPRYRSCHTALTLDGLFFEGHVPAKYIKQFIVQVKEGEHENATGLSVPAMPVGSPGMEMGNRFMPYEILILFNDGTSRVYAKVTSYEEQF